MGDKKHMLAFTDTCICQEEPHIKWNNGYVLVCHNSGIN